MGEGTFFFFATVDFKVKTMCGEGRAMRIQESRSLTDKLPCHLGQLTLTLVHEKKYIPVLLMPFYIHVHYSNQTSFPYRGMLGPIKPVAVRARVCKRDGSTNTLGRGPQKPHSFPS